MRGEVSGGRGGRGREGWRTGVGEWMRETRHHVRGDIKIPSLQPQTFHKRSHKNPKGSVT